MLGAKSIGLSFEFKKIICDGPASRDMGTFQPFHRKQNRRSLVNLNSDRKRNRQQWSFKYEISSWQSRFTAKEDMDNFENELRISFLDEAKELLVNAEQCFLNLERAKNDPTIIEQIFRLA